ncbi:MAG: hypothetical protein ACRDP8_09130 [Actinopolymorphaceae bacterium]
MLWNLDRSERNQREHVAVNLATLRTVRLFRALCGVAIVAAVMALAVLVGCAPIEGEPTGAREAGSARPAGDTTTTLPGPAKALAWGESYSYDDGLTITVGRPEAMADAGEGVSWSDYLQYSPEIDIAKVMPVRIELTVTNDGTTTVDPAVAGLNLLAADAQVDAGCVDADCGISLTNLAPGRSVSADWMWWVPRADADDLTVEVTGGLSYDQALWMGSALTE